MSETKSTFQDQSVAARPRKSIDSRKIHRWLGIAAAVLFLHVSVTGFILQIQQTFGDEEHVKEEQARVVSPFALDSNLTPDLRVLNQARAELLKRFGVRPVLSIDWKISGTKPTYVFHLSGDSPQKISVDAATGEISGIDSDEEGWVRRLHSGEFFGDAGRFLGLGWGFGLIVMTVTGIWLYVKMFRARQKGTAGNILGRRRFFW